MDTICPLLRIIWRLGSRGGTRKSSLISSRLCDVGLFASAIPFSANRNCCAALGLNGFEEPCSKLTSLKEKHVFICLQSIYFLYFLKKAISLRADILINRGGVVVLRHIPPHAQMVIPNGQSVLIM